MSNTREAKAGAPMRQERYCSAVEYDDGLKALPVAKRAELIADAELRSLIWFLQFRSLPPREQGIGRIGGLGRIADELFQTVHAAVIARGGITREKAASTYVERLTPDVGDESWRSDVAVGVTHALTDFCINPAEKSFPSLFTSFKGYSLVSDPDLPGSELLDIVRRYRAETTAKASGTAAETEIVRRVQAMLSFTFETGRACLIEGTPRTGKTSAAKAFCEANAGVARYVATPPGSAEQDLLRAVADAIGVADSRAYKNVQIRQSVEEVLRRSRLMLVFDEAQWLLPQHIRVQSMPQRLLWVKQLIDWSVPVAFVALPDFSRLLKNVGAKTGWPIEQITGRVVSEKLPAVLSESDLRKIFANHVPEAAASIGDLVVGCALQDKDQAGAIGKVVDLARFLSGRRGVAVPEFEDFKKAALSHYKLVSPAAMTPNRGSRPAAPSPHVRGDSAAPSPESVFGGRLGRSDHARILPA